MASRFCFAELETASWGTKDGFRGHGRCRVFLFSSLSLLLFSSLNRVFWFLFDLPGENFSCLIS